MGNFLFLLIAFFIGGNILRVPVRDKLNWVFAGIIFFPRTINLVGSPNITFPRFIIIVLLLDFILNYRRFAELKIFPLKRSLIFLFICLLSIGLFDNRIAAFLKFYRPFTYFYENFLVLFFSFVLIKDVNQAIKLFRFILKCLLICGVYGLIVKVIGNNVYTSFIAKTYNNIDFGNWYAINGDDRLRVSSFAWHPIYYGLIVSFGIALYVFIHYTVPSRRRQTRMYFTFIFLMLAANLFLTNSRTPLVSLIGGISIFFVFGLGFQRKIRLMLIGSGLFAAVIAISPNTFKIVGDSIDTFSSKGSDLKGSSVEMRQAQALASLAIFSQSPFFGNGFGYISEGLGYSSDSSQQRSDNSFAGFESYGYELLIEQGLAGILGNFILFFGAYRYLIRMLRRSDSQTRKLILITISMLTTFLLFIFGTGDMESITIFMLLFGANLKTIWLLNNENHREEHAPEDLSLLTTAQDSDLL